VPALAELVLKRLCGIEVELDCLSHGGAYLVDIEAKKVTRLAGSTIDNEY
jgi:hypothetical protein